MNCSNCCDSNDITLPTPTDGVGISSITLNGSNQFVITYTNGTSVTTSAVTLNSTATNVLHNDTTSETETVADGSLGTPVIVGTKTYTLPAATLSTNGSEIKCTAWFKFTTNASLLNQVKLQIYCNGAWFSSAFNGGYIEQSDAVTFRTKLDFVLTRKSNTTAFASYTADTYVDFNDTLVANFSSAGYEDSPAALGVLDFTTNPIDFACYAGFDDAAAAGSTSIDIICDSFVVEHYKK